MVIFTSTDQRKLKRGLSICILIFCIYNIWLIQYNNKIQKAASFDHHLVKILDIHALSISRRRLSLVNEYLLQLPSYFDLYDLRSKVNDTGFNCTLTKTNPRFPICVYEQKVDKFISGALLSSGVWEPDLTRVFQIALTRHPNAIVIDIGANIGYYTLLGAVMGHNVLAVEPVLENVRRLHKGVQLGKLMDNVHLLKNAMSNRHQNVCLSWNESNQGGIQVLEDTNVGEISPTITLNDLLYLMSASEVIIKIDIEGYECKAMEISDEFFKKMKVVYIFMEWQQMFRHRLQKLPCSLSSISHLTKTLTHRGYIPHEVHTGIQLNPQRSSTQWKIGDIYWRHKSLPLLIPSM